MRRPRLPALVLWLAAAPGVAGERPVLVTVDDLPIASTALHPDAAERRRITEGLLSALARHDIRAVGLVTWDRVRDEADVELLRLWLDAGHELGNHSRSHLSYSETGPEAYIADVEAARRRIQGLLDARGARLRFFRFPFLREGNTPEKLEAMRRYLEESGQRNLPPTIDNQDWSYERPWVEARRAGDRTAREAVGQEYLSALRLAVRHHERTGDALFGRPVPQILLLHANEVGAALWDDLFAWLRSAGHRFADADEVLADPAFEVEHDYVGERGPGHWDRILFERRVEQAKAEVRGLLDSQTEAWNRGDLEEFCAVYAADALFLSPDGATRGREAVLARYRRRYADPEAMGTLSLTVLEIRPAAGTEISMQGDARPSRVHGLSVAARWRLDFPGRDPAAGSTLIILRRRAAGWEIVQDASM